MTQHELGVPVGRPFPAGHEPVGAPLTWVPSSCILPSAEHPVRIAEFAALFARARAVRRVSNQHLRVSFVSADTTAMVVRELAGRESVCCSFFEFTVTSDAEQVALDVVVSAVRSEVLNGLAALVKADAL